MLRDCQVRRETKDQLEMWGTLDLLVLRDLLELTV